jgi:V-type H+-transporting ATPase subunit F
MKSQFTKKTLLIAIIADETTVTGFLLTGIGERGGKEGQRNYMICNKETSDQQLEEGFGQMIARNDIGILLISQSLAERVRNMIVEHQNNEEKLLPSILEIPSKESPYDPTKDSMLVSAAQKLFGQEAGIEKLKH